MIARLIQAANEAGLRLELRDNETVSIRGRKRHRRLAALLRVHRYALTEALEGQAIDANRCSSCGSAREDLIPSYWSTDTNFCAPCILKTVQPILDDADAWPIADASKRPEAAGYEQFLAPNSASRHLGGVLVDKLLTLPDEDHGWYQCDQCSLPQLINIVTSRRWPRPCIMTVGCKGRLTICADTPIVRCHWITRAQRQLRSRSPGRELVSTSCPFGSGASSLMAAGSGNGHRRG